MKNVAGRKAEMGYVTGKARPCCQSCDNSETETTTRIGINGSLKTDRLFCKTGFFVVKQTAWCERYYKTGVIKAHSVSCDTPPPARPAPELIQEPVPAIPNHVPFALPEKKPGIAPITEE